MDGDGGEQAALATAAPSSGEERDTLAEFYAAAQIKAAEQRGPMPWNGDAG